MNIIALIPAKGKSTRCPGKNIRPLAGHPMLFYTIAAARESGIFSGIYVSSDDPRICYMAELRGATPVPRPPEFATDTSPDIEWIDDFFRTYRCVVNDPDTKNFTMPDAFAILRPTSPFRSADTIRRAWREFQEKQPCDSVRAVEKGPDICKCFFVSLKFVDFAPHRLAPIWNETHYINGKRVPSHSVPSQLNRERVELWKQNASLEISWTRNVTETWSISGDYIKPFFTQGYEGFDVNTEEDFILAEALIERGLAKLPEVK